MITTQLFSIEGIVQLLVMLAVSRVTFCQNIQFMGQKYHYVKANDWNNLLIPMESVYPVIDDKTKQNL